MSNKINIFLDDERTPTTDLWCQSRPWGAIYRTPAAGGLEWVIVRSVEHFKSVVDAAVTLNGIESIGVISFDHDLGVDIDGNEEQDGADAAEWLVDACIAAAVPLPVCVVHSADPIGARDISQELNQVAKYLAQYRDGQS